MLACASGRRGATGCIVATWLRPVREKVRPARSHGGCEREQVRPAYSKWPKMSVLWRAGRVFRENTAEGAVPGEVFRGTAAERSVLGEFCRTTTQVRPLLGGRHLRSNREPTCWDHHERMGMKKHSRRSAWQKCRTPTGGSHRGGPLRARRDSNPQPSEP